MKALKHVIGLAMLVFSLSMQAQTDIRPILTTNFITADPSFRDVDGKLYNTARSVLFVQLKGKSVAIKTNYVAFRLIVPTMARADSVPEWNGWAGPPSEMVPVGEHESDEIVLVKHFPVELLNSSQTQFFRAIKCGIKTGDSGQTFDVYDYGLPHVVAVVTTNSLTETANK